MTELQGNKELYVTFRDPFIALAPCTNLSLVSSAKQVETDAKLFLQSFIIHPVGPNKVCTRRSMNTDTVILALALFR